MSDPQHPRPEQYPAAAPTEVPDPGYPTAEHPVAEAVPATPARSGRARMALVAAAVVGLVAVGGGGFAVGRATAPEPASTSTTTDQRFPGGGGPMGTPPDGQLGTPPGQDSTTDDGTTADPTT